MIGQHKAVFPINFNRIRPSFPMEASSTRLAMGLTTIPFGDTAQIRTHRWVRTLPAALLHQFRGRQSVVARKRFSGPMGHGVVSPAIRMAPIYPLITLPINRLDHDANGNSRQSN